MSIYVVAFVRTFLSKMQSTRVLTRGLSRKQLEQHNELDWLWQPLV